MRRIVLSCEEIRKIEEETEKKYGISRLILMENAGRSVAEQIKKIFKKNEGRIGIFCGKGNNGGDGFVVARYLFNSEYDVEVFYIDKVEEFSEITRKNFEILVKLGVKIYPFLNKEKLQSRKFGLIVDAVLGTGIRGQVKGIPREMISYIKTKRAKKVCVDVPSGLNSDTGEVCGIAVKGDLTVTFGFAKKGFYLNEGPFYCGKIKIVDIGFPKFYYLV